MYIFICVITRIIQDKLKVKTLNDRENVKDYLPLGLSLNDHTANGKLNRVIK